MAESHNPVEIRLLKTGIPGLDDVLGGGIPELSFNLVAGGPGSGKTTVVLQFLFANATAEGPALYFTVLGEPTLKLLRHQQQFPFFDVARVGKDVQFVHLGALIAAGDLDGVLQRIIAEVARVRPRFVAVDSFRALARVASSIQDRLTFERFLQELAMQLTTWEVTSFLLGEYATDEMNGAVFTLADGILSLSQAVDRNSVVRKLQVVKVRGQPSMPGLHTFRIAGAGVQVFPRMRQETGNTVPRPSAHRMSMGSEVLDEMTGGGIPAGDVVLIAGPTGCGKTTFAIEFAIAGLRNGESVVVAGFEEYPREYLARAEALGGEDFRKAVKEGRFRILYLRPLDLSVDEAMEELRDAAVAMGATRVVIDSLAGFEVALAPTFREDFRESLHRLLGVMTATGATVMLTNEVADAFIEQRMTTHGVWFLCDDIILTRYVEIEGVYRKAASILKMRGSAHKGEFRLFDITSKGVVIGKILSDYSGIMTGTPRFTPGGHEYYGPPPKETAPKK